MTSVDFLESPSPIIGAKSNNQGEDASTGASNDQSGRFSTTDRAFYVVGDITVILNTTDEGETIDETFASATKTCLIYAETINLNLQAALPSLSGHNVSLFCSMLNVTVKSSINVTGSSGTSSGSTQANNPTINGQAGGSITLSVENLSSSNLKDLSLIADGGDGAAGVDGAAANDTPGGQGGSAGNGGQITVIYSHEISQMLVHLAVSNYSKTWTDRTARILQDVIPLFLVDQIANLDPDNVDTFQNVVNLYGQYKSGLQTVLPQLSQVISPNNYDTPDPSPALTKAAQNAQDAITAELNAPDAPMSISSADITAISALSTLLTSWITAADDSPTDAALLTSIKNFETDSIIKTGSESALDQAVGNISPYLVSVWNSVQDNIRSICDVSAGQPGAGGNSPPNIPPGPIGDSGSPGSYQSYSLAFTTTTNANIMSDVSIPEVFAHPDQCRMLFSKAQGLFFAGGIENWTNANKHFKNLVQRLAFVPALVEESNALKDVTKASPLLTAYLNMQNRDNLTIQFLTQLQDVYISSQHCLGQLSTGQDMFNRIPSWAPRLSVQFYKKQIADQMKVLQIIETQTTAYAAQATTAQGVLDAATAGLNQTQTIYEIACDKIELITESNGQLAQAGTKIALATPVLAAKRLTIQNKLNKVKADIESHIDWNIDSLVNSLATVAMMPGYANAAVQTLSAGYNMFTKITNNQGQQVDKNYVISQLTTCGGTIDSLKEAYTVNASGSIDVDQPSSLKITATAEDISSILTQFKSAIPSKDSGALSKALDDYMSVINTRNSAIMDYNSLIVVLADALKDKETSQARMQELSNIKASLNPDLPAIAFWLQQTQDMLRLEVMRLLNYQNRALQFWALIPPTSFGDPGPLRDSTDLQLDISSLNQAFETATNNLYESEYWAIWPSPDQQTRGGGLWYQVSSSDLLAFQISQSSDPSSYTVDIELSPDVLGIPPTDGSPAVKLFAGKSNIRLSQVRVWLLNVQGKQPDAQGRNPITVHITQLGAESFWDSQNVKYDFTHESVTMDFEYDFTNVKTLADCTPDVVMTEEDIPNNYVGGQQPAASSVAAIGPFATWRIQVVTDVNPGVKLSPQDSPDLAMYIEFWGASSTVQS